MSFNFSNLLNRDNLKAYPYPLKINGNCVITNYKGSNTNVANPFTITKKDNEITVKGLSDQAYKDLHNSLEVLARLTAYDGNPEDLSADDLKFAKQDFINSKSLWESLGVTSFRYDSNGNVANLSINGNTLRIDFDDNIKTNDIKKTQQTKQTQQPKEIKQTKTDNKPAILEKPKSSSNADKYAGIDKKWIPLIKNASKKWGYSEEIIITKMLAEGFTPVAVHKKEGTKKGLNEVGFGHTTNAKHNNKFKPGFRISNKQAIEWLCQDIKDKEDEIRRFGSYYNYKTLPQPLKDMMIDVAFNRGENRLDPTSKLFDKNYKSVIANIKNEYWGSAAVRLRQEEFSEKIKRQGKEPGLRKRNVQRFLKLMDYLLPEKVVGAMDLFNRELYYTKTLNMLKKGEADSLREQWNKIYYAAKAKCPKQ